MSQAFLPPQTVPIAMLHVEGGEAVLGTHIFPLRLVGWPFELASATEVAGSYVTPIDRLEVLVTRMGGLFVRVPESLCGLRHPDSTQGDLSTSYEARAQFADKAVSAFNLVVCEFTFTGVFSEPTSQLHLGPGSLKDGRASIHGGAGPTTERTLGPSLMMGLNPMWKSSWETIADEQLAQTAGLPRAIALWNIADSLPTFVASAYFFLSQRLLAEALLDAWIVVEQIVNWLWENEYMPTSRNRGHRERLDDTRSFTANVKAELLLAHGTIDGETYDALQQARRRRNDLAHGGHVAVPGAFECMSAMRAMLGRVVSGEIPRPAFSEFVNF